MNYFLKNLSDISYVFRKRNFTCYRNGCDGFPNLNGNDNDINIY